MQGSLLTIHCSYVLQIMTITLRKKAGSYVVVPRKEFQINTQKWSSTKDFQTKGQGLSSISITVMAGNQYQPVFGLSLNQRYKISTCSLHMSV